MPPTENQPSFLRRISIRRNQVVSMEGNHEQELEDLELFQKHVADRFSGLLSPPGQAAAAEEDAEPLLSIPWLRKLVDVFLCCEAEFKAVLIMGRDPSQISKPPLDRLIPEFLERAVKVLDICNGVFSGVGSVRHCQKLAEIAVCALEKKPITDGQVNRAKRALTSLLHAMTANDDKESSHHKATTERAWSFGKRGSQGGANRDRPAGSFRSLSMIVAKNWSASKQIQAMCSNLVAPRGGGESNGLASPVYVMSCVMVFVMWALVAAIPCQERSGLSTRFQIPRQLAWAHSMTGLQEKIGEEWKKREKKGSAGLLEEMRRMERLGQSLIEFSANFQFPGEADKVEEAMGQVAELSDICQRMEEGLVPLQQQIREVFHRVVRSRTEFLELLDHAGKVSQPLI